VAAQAQYKVVPAQAARPPHQGRAMRAAIPRKQPKLRPVAVVAALARLVTTEHRLPQETAVMAHPIQLPGRPLPTLVVVAVGEIRAAILLPEMAGLAAVEQADQPGRLASTGLPILAAAAARAAASRWSCPRQAATAVPASSSSGIGGPRDGRVLLCQD
jgi:hypothetical protein